MKPTVILSWSGGIDSTSCLWQLLRDGVEVLVHHVVLKTPERRWECERRAVQAIRKWFEAKGLTNYVYHETGFDYGTVRRMVRDISIIGFVAGFVLAGYPSVRRYCVCGSATDDRRAGIGAAKERRRILVEVMAGRELEWIQPNKSKEKSQVMAEMPPDLLKLCWYCRRPVNGRPCGQCHTCREVAKGMRINAAG